MFSFMPMLSSLGGRDDDDDIYRYSRPRTYGVDQGSMSVNPPTSYGAFMPRMYGGLPVDESAARRARGQALMALGLGLMQGGAQGDYAGGLTQGVAGFSEALEGGLERNRQRTMDKMQIDRQEAQERDRKAAHGLSMETGEKSLEITTEEQSRGQAERASKAATVRQLADRITTLAQTNPEVEGMAAKARALAESPNADLFIEEMQNLADAADQRASRESDAEFAIGVSVDEQEAKKNAPSARREEGRDDARTRAYVDSVGNRGVGGGRYSFGAEQDDIRALANDKYKVLKDEAEAKLGGKPGEGRWTPEGFKTNPAPDYRALQNQAWAEAEAEIRARRGGAGGTGGQLTEADIDELVAEKGTDGARRVLRANGYSESEIDRMIGGGL